MVRKRTRKVFRAGGQEKPLGHFVETLVDESGDNDTSIA